MLGETEDIVYPLNPDSNKPIADLCARDIDGNVTPLKKMVLRKGKTASRIWVRALQRRFHFSILLQFKRSKRLELRLTIRQIEQHRF